MTVREKFNSKHLQLRTQMYIFKEKSQKSHVFPFFYGKWNSLRFAMHIKGRTAKLRLIIKQEISNLCTKNNSALLFIYDMRQSLKKIRSDLIPWRNLRNLKKVLIDLLDEIIVEIIVAGKSQQHSESGA